MKDQALQQLSHSCNAACSTFANSISNGTINNTKAENLAA